MSDFEDNDEYFLLIQAKINSLAAWQLEGSEGRAMMSAIEAGRCCLGFDHTYDFWGNRIPSRTEVQAGTKGSFEFVAEAYGQEWADAVAAVPYKSAMEVYLA